MKTDKFILFPLFFVLYEFTVYLANDMIMPGMIKVVHDFSVGNAYVPGSLTAFLLGGASLQIVLGPFSDSFGRRKTLLFGVVFFLFSTAFILFSQSIHQFLFGRFIQGMGLCFIGTVGYACIQEMYEERQAIKIISMMAMVALIAPLAGPLLGGIFIEYFHWRGVFVVIGALGTIALIGLHLHMPETAHLSLSKDNILERYPDLSNLPKFNLFHLSKNYLAIMKNKKFLLGAFASSLSTGPLLAWISISPILLMKKAHLSPTGYGISQIPIFGALIVGNLLLQKIIKKSDLKRIIRVGAFFTLVGLFLAGLVPLLLGESFLNVLIPLSIYAFGIAVTNSTLTRLILYSSPIAKGSVSAILSLITTSILALNTFSMTFIYKTESNVHFGIFCFFVGLVFFPLISLFLISDKRAS